MPGGRSEQTPSGEMSRFQRSEENLTTALCEVLCASFSSPMSKLVREHLADMGFFLNVD